MQKVGGGGAKVLKGGGGVVKSLTLSKVGLGRWGQGATFFGQLFPHTVAPILVINDKSLIDPIGMQPSPHEAVVFRRK